ncbi:MAG: NOP5/NOP56 family protein [Nitrososphaerales archaeon]
MSKFTVLLLEAGVVVLDDQNNLLRSLKFDTNSMVNSYKLIKSGTASDQFEEIIERVKSQGYQSAVVNDEGLLNIMTRHGIDTSLMSSEEQLAAQEKKTNIMLSANFAPNEFEALNLLRKFAIALSSVRVAEVSAKLDLHIIQSVNSLDELDKIINLMGARLREWYGLHFPELDAMIQSLPAYCDIVNKAGVRDDIDQHVLKDVGIQDNRAEEIIDAATSSKGGGITVENVAALKRIAEEIKHLNTMRGTLTSHLEHEMDTVAPNVKEILGATIGARMIAKAGSLDRLATLPASTIQVIGAEKALFRALKSGSQPPKHGIIFQHQLVHSAPKWQRGKIARAIAGKVAIAARIDAYNGGRNTSIAKKLSERIEEIRQKYKEPVEHPRHVEERVRPRFQRRKRWERRRRFGKRRR